ncbi:MAG: ATP-binding protein [bacterium]|nr:ATP-binding protein [bacterium]
MRRLWVQLSLAFGGVVIISAILLITITSMYAQWQFQIIEQDFLQRFPELQSASPPPMRMEFPPPMGFPRPEHILLILVSVGVVMGILGGIIMSKRLSAPLSRLAEVARKFGERDFSQRVPMKKAGSLEIHEVALAFNDMADGLQKSEQLRNNLIADVAHELRTPLSVMSSNLRALIDDVYPLTKTEILHLYDQTRHLTRLVNDLHELSLADAHELPFEKTDVDIVALIQHIVGIFTPIAESEMIRVMMVADDKPLCVFGDRGRLEQVIQNLLVNALRHTAENGEITLQVRGIGDRVQISISDTGVGIAPEHVEHVFERFYRADKSRQRESGGAGLGLAIGRAIIEAHGGKMTVTSQTTAPSGTTFTITLPIHPKEAP